MDAASVLEQYVSDLTNLPAEIAYIFEEIRDKDLKFYETRKRIQQRDNQIHKFIRVNGSLADNPKEAASYPKIRGDFEKAMALQQSKCDLANMGLYIISRQVKKLNDDIQKLEAEGLMAPPSDGNGYAYDTPSRQASTAPSGRANARPTSQVAALAAFSSQDRKRSPAPGSRGSTPSANRPTKRQKVSVINNESDASAPSTPNVGATRVSHRPQGGHANGDEEEVLYCTCQQVSFGNMVACDNPDCQYEWFHYDCVGLTEPPNGTWYCPMCSKDRKDNGDFKDVARRKR